MIQLRPVSHRIGSGPSGCQASVPGLVRKGLQGKDTVEMWASPSLTAHSWINLSPTEIYYLANLCCAHPQPSGKDFTPFPSNEIEVVESICL